MSADRGEAGRLTGSDDVRAFILAGNARFTLVSGATGARFTYRVRRPDEAGVWFVSTRHDGERPHFLGTIFADGSYRHGKRSRIPADATEAKAFAWLWAHLATDALAKAEVWHEGSCGKCGRALTVPESIATGLGPVCAGKAPAMRRAA